MKSQLTDGNGDIQEIDLWESYCGNYGYSSSNGTFSGHEWAAGNPNQIASGGGSFGSGSPWAQTNMDSNWHSYSLVWMKTGTNTGTIQCFFDHSAQTIWNGNAGAPYSTSAIPTGAGGAAGFQVLDTAGDIYIILGGPPGTNFNVDYVNVWTA
jgi:hypothetical protein